jgi:hypothetical protein
MSSHILSGSRFKEDNPDLEYLVNPKQSDYKEEIKEKDKVYRLNIERFKRTATPSS